MRRGTVAAGDTVTTGSSAKGLKGSEVNSSAKLRQVLGSRFYHFLGIILYVALRDVNRC